MDNAWTWQSTNETICNDNFKYFKSLPCNVDTLVQNTFTLKDVNPGLWWREKIFNSTNLTVGMENSHCSYAESNLPRWFTEPISLLAFQTSAQHTNTKQKFQFSVYWHLLIWIKMHNSFTIPTEGMLWWFTTSIEFNHLTWQLFEECSTSNYSYNIISLHRPVLDFI